MNEREITVWLRNCGPEHLRGAHPNFDILRAAIGFYADSIAAKVGGMVMAHARYEERSDPTKEALRGVRVVNEVVKEMSSKFPVFLRFTVSSVCRITYLSRFTGVVVTVCAKNETSILGGIESARYIVVNLEQEQVT